MSYNTYRGYGGRGYRGSGNLNNNYRRTNTVSVEPELDMYEGLSSKSITKINNPSITNETHVEITDVRDIGSYNWVESSITQPTIIVPGCPAVWSNREPPFTIQRDAGLFVVDQNSYRMAKYPLLPLVKAVEVVQKGGGNAGLDWSSVDFVTDRNGLRKLVRWIKGSNEWLKGTQNSLRPKTFRIDMQLVGDKTVLLSRWNPRLRDEVIGYGNNFEKDCTKLAPGCEGSTGHHRIVNYNFEGLNMVVRYEVDACIATNTAIASVSASSQKDDLEVAMASLSIKPAATTRMASVTEDNLTIRKAGEGTPRPTVVELTTLREERLPEFVWDEVYFQLLLSQTPNHFLGLHKGGRFSKIERRRLPELTEKLSEGGRAQNIMKTLKSVLEAIQGLAIEHGLEGRLTLVCDGTELKVYNRKSGESFLPESVLTLFN